MTTNTWASDPANAVDTTHTADIPEVSVTSNTHPDNSLEVAELTGHEGAVATGGYNDCAGAGNDEDAAGVAAHEDAAGAVNHEDATGGTNHEDTAAAADSEDTADALLDADLFETLIQDFNCSSTPGPDQPTPPDQPPADGSQPSDPAPPPPAHIEYGDSDSPTVVVDHFPHGNPGAPISEAHQGRHIYQTSQDLFGPSLWAPFRSQRDWQIAHWAKTRGPTSSALGELLAIPNVRARLLFDNLCY